MNVLLFMMGGSGTRFGASIPKQYTLIDGKPLFLPTIRKYQKIQKVDKIVIVSHPSWLQKVKEWCEDIHKLVKIVEGGRNRSESVLNGLRAISSFAQAEDLILIHDATHPYVDIEGTYKVIEKARAQGAATLANFNHDTVYRINDEYNISEVLPRTRIVNGASPEAFKFRLIYPIYEKASKDELEKMTSAGAIALENNIDIAFIETDILNLKITYPRDLDLYLRLKNYFFN